jgi:SPP1 gp7 family putative phage head morphogenesis protein
MPYVDKSRETIEKFQSRLMREEKEEFLLLAKKWNVVYSTIEEKILSLSTLENLSRNQLYQLELYKDFLKIAKQQITKYSKETAEIIAGKQLEFATQGITSIRNILLDVKFNQLPLTAIEKFIGQSQEGGTLYSLLQNSYPETVGNLTNTLLRGIALGDNPTKIARMMKNDMDGNLTRALRIARTEQMFIFREASKMQMEESGVLKGYELIAEPDACDLCLSQTDKLFRFEDNPELHPNCRCAYLPVI